MDKLKRFGFYQTALIRGTESAQQNAQNQFPVIYDFSAYFAKLTAKIFIHLFLSTYKHIISYLIP